MENLSHYDYVIIAGSGGKDSTAMILLALSLGIQKEKIEIWHHSVDGNAGQHFVDWPVTEDYCRQMSRALEIPVYFSWRVGGFHGEMLRDNAPTSPVQFEMPVGEAVQIGEAGGKGKNGTRRKFPQKTHDFKTRWCTPCLKIGVMESAIINQERFRSKKVLVMTGERGEESPARRKLRAYEPHRTDLRHGRRYQRLVDHWRPILEWNERKVWDIIRAHHINPHPAYKLGFGRLSCMSCIFADPDQWATIHRHFPDRFRAIRNYETEFGITIDRKRPLDEVVRRGRVYPDIDPRDVRMAMSRNYTGDILINKWKLPAGAFRQSGGPS